MHTFLGSPCHPTQKMVTPVRQPEITSLHSLTLFIIVVLSELYCQILTVFHKWVSIIIHILSTLKVILTKVSASMNTHLEY